MSLSVPLGASKPVAAVQEVLAGAIMKHYDYFLSKLFRNVEQLFEPQSSRTVG